MRKLYIALLVTLLYFTASDAKAIQISISCTPDPSATNYTLFSSVAGAPYASVGTSTTCTFTPTIDDTKQTCFQFGASNANGSVTRTWTWICYDPTKLPPPPPSQEKVQ